MELLDDGTGSTQPGAPPLPVKNVDRAMVGVVAIGLFVVATQGYALWNARELDGHMREWEAGTTQREREREVVASEATLFEQTKAELARLKTERDRAQAEFSKAQRDLDLARQDLAKATSERDAVGLKSASAKLELTLAEERVTSIFTTKCAGKLRGRGE